MRYAYAVEFKINYVEPNEFEQQTSRKSNADLAFCCTAILARINGKI